MACAVTGAPFERVSQYLKRGELTLILDQDRTSGGRRAREWVVSDVLKLVVLKELTDLGLSVGTASAFTESPYGCELFAEVGGSANVHDADYPEQFFVVTRSEQGEAVMTLSPAELLRSVMFSPDADWFSMAVVDVRRLARAIRRKLAALGALGDPI